MAETIKPEHFSQLQPWRPSRCGSGLFHSSPRITSGKAASEPLVRLGDIGTTFSTQ
jgi:hypothetical protein